MKFRGLLIAVVVLLVLGGLLYWSNHHKPAAETPSASSSTAPPTILKFDSGSVAQVSLARKGVAPVTLAKSSGGHWQITTPQSYPADQDVVSGLLASLSNLTADRVVEDKASDLKAYGLDDPSVTLNVTLKDHKDHKLLLGDDTPAGSDIYAMLTGDPRIFTIASYTKTSVDKGLNDLRDKRLLTVQPDKVSRVSLEKKGQAIEFARTKDGWQILKPNPLRADAFAVDEFVRSVTDARMDLNAKDNEHPATDFAKATPLATVTLTGNQGPQMLTVRKNKDDYFAKSSIVDRVYKVDSSVGTALSKSLDDFRNKKLFDFGFETPSKIEFHAGSKSWFLTHSGNDWWSNGKKMEGAAVDALVENLRNLTAASFPDSGFTTPAIEATVTSSDGKQKETVLIANSGTAKRDKEPALYQLAPSTVTNLTNSFNALKPAASAVK
ncbi:MAG: DUF4340 domain-containing protein [Terracidiphilus sp.]